METLLTVPLSIWFFFIAGIIFLLVIDLGLFNRKAHEIGIKESMLLSLFYFVIACLFGIWIYYYFGSTSAKEYFTGYLIEKSLTLDNIFVISLIFSHLAIPRLYQHRVLFWGVLGVIILRGMMIGAGAVLIAKFSWVLYFFAAFLVLTGIKMLWKKEEHTDLANNKTLLFLQKILPITKELHGHAFFVKLPKTTHATQSQWWVTPLFVTLLFIEFTDLVFALDSIPAVFTITQEPFIIYTSNIFAILGVRALYFALSDIITRFVYLKQALALVLIFIGSKVFITDFLGLAKFPATLSLSITVLLIAGGIVYSLYRSRRS